MVSGLVTVAIAAALAADRIVLPAYTLRDFTPLERVLTEGRIVLGYLATLVAPKTRDWSRASAAIQEYIDEQQEKQEHALSLAELVETAKQDVAA